MMRRILVALDGSPESEKILEEVERVGGAQGSIDLLHVLPRVEREVPNVGVTVEDVAEEYLRKVAARLLKHPVRTFIWRGEPQEEIPKAARRLKADLIAMTTHARKGLSHLLLGSVAEAVVRNSSTPVLLTRPDLPRPRKALERILVPLDGSAASREVFVSVRSLVGDSGAEVILFQVVVPILVGDPVTGFTPIGIPQPLPDPRPRLEEAARRLALEGFRTRAVVASGDAADQILDHARSLDADLIAMATAGRKGFSRFMIGSVAEKVVRRMDRPVLLHRITPKAEAASQLQELHAQGAD
jgi:nucleotide-binding universal stress UspA family protein